MPSPRPPLRVIEGGDAAPPSLGRALEFAALGAALTLLIALLARLPGWAHDVGRFQALTLAAFAPYALALARARRYASLPHVGWVVFAVALATRAALVPVPPTLSDDIHRYVWEGRVVLAGGDPYRQAPDDPALAHLRDRVVWPRVNHPHLATIYPPLAEAQFAAVAAVAPTVLAMKLWVALHDLALVAVLVAWLARRGDPTVLALAYAWNPLVLVEYAGTGHNDPTALLPLAIAFAVRERRPVLSAVAFAAAVLTKLAPLVALPFLVRAWPWRARIVAVALLAPGLAWFAAATRGASSGALAYWDAWRNNESLFWILDRLAGGFAPARTIAIALVVALIAWALLRRRTVEAGARLASRGALLLAPVLHPWYLGWALLYEPLAPSWPWIALSCTALLNYGVFATPAEGGAYHLPVAWRAVEYGVPLALAIGLAIARRRRAGEERA